MGNVVTQEAILGAIARGWCYPETSNRIMDVELATAIGKEICILLGIEWNDH